MKNSLTIWHFASVLLLPALCASSSSVQSRNLKDKKPNACTSGEACSCKTFLDNLAGTTFQNANKTAWETFQSSDGYKQVITEEEAVLSCGPKHNEKDCALTFPKFPKDQAYSTACTSIGGYLCSGSIIHEKCTQYLHGGEDCSRTTIETWKYSGDAVRFCVLLCFCLFLFCYYFFKDLKTLNKRLCNLSFSILHANINSDNTYSTLSRVSLRVSLLLSFLIYLPLDLLAPRMSRLPGRACQMVRK